MKHLKKEEVEMKYQCKFVVEFPENLGLSSWVVTRITKPQYSYDKWGQIQIGFVDPIGPSTSEALYNLIEIIKVFKEHNSPSPLFIFKIKSLDPVGGVIEVWEIGVGDVVNINFGSLDYNSDSPQEPTMIIQPAYCKYVDL